MPNDNVHLSREEHELVEAAIAWMLQRTSLPIVNDPVPSSEAAETVEAELKPYVRELFTELANRVSGLAQQMSEPRRIVINGLVDFLFTKDLYDLQNPEDIGLMCTNGLLLGYLLHALEAEGVLRIPGE